MAKTVWIAAIAVARFSRSERRKVWHNSAVVVGSVEFSVGRAVAGAEKIDKIKTTK